MAKVKPVLPTTKREPLTMRETEVSFLISKDMSNPEIARALKIGVETVKEHVQNSLRKLKFRSRVGIAIWYVTTKA